jgi:hypothetical protein
MAFYNVGFFYGLILLKNETTQQLLTKIPNVELYSTPLTV